MRLISSGTQFSPIPAIAIDNPSVPNEAIQVQESSAENLEDDKTHENTPPVNTRVQASSKVNFLKLNPEEQYQRFRNQAYEIKQLRRFLRKKTQKGDDKSVCEYEKAKEAIKKAKYELPDMAHLLENLIKAINTNALAPGSLAYAHICTILRSKLGIDYTKCPCRINLGGGKSVPISSAEFQDYKKLHADKNLAVLSAIVGESCQETASEQAQAQSQCVGDPVSQFLMAQANLISTVNFNQFALLFQRRKTGF